MLHTNAFYLLKRDGDGRRREKSEAQGYRAQNKDNQELPLATLPPNGCPSHFHTFIPSPMPLPQHKHAQIISELTGLRHTWGEVDSLWWQMLQNVIFFTNILITFIKLIIGSVSFLIMSSNFVLSLLVSYSGICPWDFPHEAHNNLASLLYFYLHWSFSVLLYFLKFLFQQHQHGRATEHEICSK